MKTLRTFAKILAVALVISLVFSFAACDLFGGSLELEGFTVDRSTVKTVYYIGEEIDFTGIKATVRYSDDSLDAEYTFEDLTITYDPDITATVGTKQVTVSFWDSNLETTQSVIVQITVKEDPNAPKHDSYAVDPTGMKTTYFVGEALDFSGAKVIEKWTNGGADVEMTDLSTLEFMYDSSVTATPGTKSINAKYNGEGAGAISITVKYPELTNATLNTTGVKTDYMAGDTLDLSGLSATLNYENGATKTVTSFTADVDMTTPGAKTVILTYTDPVTGAPASASYDIRVDAVENYVLNTSGMTLAYFTNDEYSFEGIVVTAQYYFADDVVLTLDQLTFVHEDNLTATAGQKKVEVKVGDLKIGEFYVAVGDIIATPTLNTTGVKTQYKQGEALDLTGLTLSITYSDPDKAAKNDIPLSALTLPTNLADLTNEGTVNGKDVTFTITYNDDVTDGPVYVQLTVKVYSPTYSITSQPTKTTYYKGETISYDGLVVVATYKHLEGETFAVPAADVTVAGSTIADSTILKNVTVGGKAAGTISITVLKNTIVSIVVSGEYNTVYGVGQTVDFSGITGITVTYVSGYSVFIPYAELTFAPVDTSVENNNLSAKFTFTDSVNGETSEGGVSIKVVLKKTVTAVEKPSQIIAFESDNKNAGTLSYGDTGFSGQFANKVDIYRIGDDNEFIYIPTVTVDNNGVDTDLDAFYADVQIYAWIDGEYKQLERISLNDIECAYYYGDTHYANVNTLEGTYKFSFPIDKVKIEVKPSDLYYLNTESFNPVVLEAMVVDGYNIHKAWQLAVIDNAGRVTDNDDYYWDWVEFKNKKEITGINPNAVILHDDLDLTPDAFPEEMFLYTTKEITYTKTVNGAPVEITMPVGTPYLRDLTYIYSHTGTDLTIHGNMFTISLTKFPYVASPSVFGDGENDYGGDYSNSALFRFSTLTASGNNYNTEFVRDENGSNSCDVVFNNVSLIGNAARDNMVVKGTSELASAGGLLLVRSDRHACFTANNVINNSFFLSYLAEFGGHVTLNSVKCYDSYQNAAFTTRHSTLTVNDSYFSGTGGPVIITQSEYHDKDKNDDVGAIYYNPQTVINNSILDTHLVGDELWFQAVGATSLIGGIKAIGGAVDQLVQQGSGGKAHANIVNGEGKMNIKGVLMPSGSNTDILSTPEGVQISGLFYIDGEGINRYYDPTDMSTFSMEWATILQSAAFQAGAPYLTVFSGGTAYTIYFVQTSATSGYFCDINGHIIDGTLQSDVAIFGAFATADEIVLHQGGLSVIFDLYH